MGFVSAYFHVEGVQEFFTPTYNIETKINNTTLVANPNFHA